MEPEGQYGEALLLDVVEYCGVVSELGRPIRSQAWGLKMARLGKGAYHQS